MLLQYFHGFVCMFVVFSLHPPPLHPPHPECQSPVPTPDCRRARRCPSPPPSPPPSSPPFCRAGRTGSSAAWRRSCPTSAAAGPEAQHTEGHIKRGQIQPFGQFFFFVSYISQNTFQTPQWRKGNLLRLAFGATSEQWKLFDFEGQTPKPDVY